MLVAGGALSPLPEAAADVPAPAVSTQAAEQPTFRDVTTGTKYHGEITWLASEGVSTGWPDKTFRPLQSVNRDAMAAFMYRLQGSPAYTPPKVSPFRDVDPGAQFYKEISWLASEKISTGWTDGTFRPLTPVNRDAMAAFMYRLADSPAYNAPTSSAFRDVGTRSQFYKHISWLASQQISTGWADGTFRPGEAVNRDAMAAFMYRFDHRDVRATLNLSEQRILLRNRVTAAKADYVDSRPYIDLLVRLDARAVKDAIDEGTDSLAKASHLIDVDVAKTQQGMDKAELAVDREEQRAAVVIKTAKQLKTLKDLRETHRQKVVAALADMNAGRISTAAYKAAKDRGAAFSTILAADKTAQLKTLGYTKPTALRSASWKDELVNATGTIPTAAGWTGFPGGCALPTAEARFTPKLPATGPGIATNSTLVNAAKVRGANNATLAPIHEQMLRSATDQANNVLTLDQLRYGYSPRIARLGYGWLEDGNTKARDALRNDLKRVLEAGPESMDTLGSSHLLLAAATAADWSETHTMDETALVRWIGPQTCLHVDKENWVDGPINIAAIHNAATFTAAAVFLEDSPAQAAALAKESLVSIQPSLRELTTDGGTGEGPGYWSYQSRAVAALYSTLPNVYTTMPMAIPSLNKVADYALNSTGSNGIPTPFADGRPESLSPLMPAWVAHTTKDPGIAAWVNKELHEKPDAYLMWWWAQPGKLPAKQTSVYPYTGFAALQLPGSTATLKGGNNTINHAHLDIGTVSFDRHGVQWAVDPGQPQNSPSGYYSDSTRWGFWWPSSVAHSTLMVGQSDQPVTAKGQVSLLSSSSAAVDMTQALRGTSSAKRTITQGSTSLVVKDTVRSASSLPLTWQWITDASVTLDSSNRRAALRKDGKQVSMKFDGAPSGSVLTKVTAPYKGPDGETLTVILLTMPKVTSLNLTTTVW